MLNHATLEALYSATYVENYLDCVENLPDDLQRLISRARELDVTYRAFLLEARQQQEVVLKDCDTINKKKSGLIKIQQALIAAQEIGDDKLEIVQQIQDIIENKSRQLDLDSRSLLDIGKEQETQEVNKENSNGNQIAASANTNGNSTGERASKRARRTRTDTAPSIETNVTSEDAPTPEPARQQVQQTQQATPVNSNTSVNQKKAGNSGTGKKKKRKSRQSTQQQQQLQQREESPPPEDMAVDPDEPTYCLCDQISYGEMIMCDNDLCPFEWFHFSCVSLGIKPKGKWYCPKCRGDRSSVMKPKAQFLKELERYHKEKELKEDKGS